MKYGNPVAAAQNSPQFPRPDDVVGLDIRHTGRLTNPVIAHA